MSRFDCSFIFSVIFFFFEKGDKFCYFLFAFLNDLTLSK